MSRCLLLTLLALSVASLRAETFTIEGAVSRALKSNPDLAAARWSIEEARGRLWQSGRLPNPELEAELKPNVKGREFSLSAGFVQKFPLTNRLWLERAISEAEVTVAEAEVRNAARLLAAEVRTTAVKLLAAQALKTLREEQRRTTSELAAEAGHAAEAGEGSALDAAHFELEAKQFSLELLKVDAEVATLTGLLRPLVGMSGNATLAMSGELQEPSAAGKGLGPESRGDYDAAIARELAARTAMDLARAAKWDDATWGLSYEREHTEDSGYGLRRENVIGLKFSVPLPLRNKNEGKVREAAAAASKAAREREALELRIRGEGEAALAEMAATAKIIERTAGPILKEARELEDRHAAANKLGQASLSDVLRSREMRFQLEETRLNALRDWHLARVRLLAARGR